MVKGKFTTSCRPGDRRYKQLASVALVRSSRCDKDVEHTKHHELGATAQPYTFCAGTKAEAEGAEKPHHRQGRNLKQVGERQSPAACALEAKHEVQTGPRRCRGVG